MKHCDWEACSLLGLHNRDDGIAVWWCHSGEVKERFPERVAHVFELTGWDGYLSDTYLLGSGGKFGVVAHVEHGAPCLLVEAPGQMTLAVTS